MQGQTPHNKMAVYEPQAGIFQAGINELRTGIFCDSMDEYGDRLTGLFLANASAEASLPCSCFLLQIHELQIHVPQPVQDPVGTGLVGQATGEQRFSSFKRS